MKVREPNRHEEQDEAWKKRELAYAKYYLKKRAQDINEGKMDYTAKGISALRVTKKRKAKLSSAWIRMDAIDENDEELGLDADAPFLVERNGHKLKEPGDYREVDTKFGVRYEVRADGSRVIMPFTQKVLDVGHQHTDVDFNIFDAIHAIRNFKERYDKAFDFAAGQCGSSYLEIDFPKGNISKTSMNRLMDLLAMAESRQIQVDLGPNIVEYLGSMQDAKKVEAIYERVRQVNAEAEKRKQDPEFINSIEASMLDQYNKEFKDTKFRLQGAPGDDEEKKRKKFAEEIIKTDGANVTQVDKTLEEIEKRMKGYEPQSGTDPRVPGFEERMKAFENGEKELTSQLEKPIQALDGENPDMEHIAIMAEGPEGNKAQLRDEMLTGLSDEADDLKSRATVMLDVVVGIKEGLERTPEAARTDEQKAQLTKIETLEKTLAANKKTLDGFKPDVDPAAVEPAAESRLDGLNEKNKRLETAVNQYRTSPRAH